MQSRGIEKKIYNNTFVYTSEKKINLTSNECSCVVDSVGLGKIYREGRVAFSIVGDEYRFLNNTGGSKYLMKRKRSFIQIINQSFHL